MSGTVAGMEWPARCVRCGLVTEDPDAYRITEADMDGEYAPSHACPAVSWEHEWATVPDDATEALPTVEEMARALHATLGHGAPGMAEALLAHLRAARGGEG